MVKCNFLVVVYVIIKKEIKEEMGQVSTFYINFLANLSEIYLCQMLRPDPKVRLRRYTNGKSENEQRTNKCNPGKCG